MKYKLYKKNLEVWKRNIYLLPTIKIEINNLLYYHDNFSIEFHFLVFHTRLLWLKGW